MTINCFNMQSVWLPITTLNINYQHFKLSIINIEDKVKETNVDKKSAPFDLKFNECKESNTGEIPKSSCQTLDQKKLCMKCLAGVFL